MWTNEPRLGEEMLQRPMKLIDLSRPIYTDMPIWPGHQKPFVLTNQTHEEFKEIWETTVGFHVQNLLISEHTGTHTDALFEVNPHGTTIDKMPLEYFYGEGICLDLRHVRHPDYITVEALEEAERNAGREIWTGAQVLLYTGHGDRTFPERIYAKQYTGLSRESATWLAERGAINLGIDSVSVDHSDDLEFSAHVVCAEYGITNTETLTNLD